MKISLALGGGGVKCFAQIGALEILEQQGFEVCAVAATSAGGFLATFYAAGYSLKEISELFTRIDYPRMTKRKKGEKNTIYGLQSFKEYLRPYLKGLNFQDLRIPLGLTCVDIDSFRPVSLTRGNVLDALIAAVAIPGLFPPQNVGGKRLSDGGMADPVPVPLAQELGLSLPVVAIVLGTGSAPWGDHPFPKLMRTLPYLNAISGLRLVRAFDLFVRANEITLRNLTELYLQQFPPDILIRVMTPHLGIIDSTDPETLIQSGRDAANTILDSPHGGGVSLGVRIPSKQNFSQEAGDVS